MFPFNYLAAEETMVIEKKVENERKRYLFISFCRNIFTVLIKQRCTCLLVLPCKFGIMTCSLLMISLVDLNSSLSPFFLPLTLSLSFSITFDGSLSSPSSLSLSQVLLISILLPFPRVLRVLRSVLLSSYLSQDVKLNLTICLKGNVSKVGGQCTAKRKEKGHYQ